MNDGRLFGIAVIEFWGAIPVAVAAQLNVVAAFIACVVGATTGVVIAAFFGGRIEEWFDSRKKPGKKGRGDSVRKVFDKYGTVGLGLIGPFATGALLACVLGVALGAPRRSLVLWLFIGIVVWSVILLAAAYLGVAGVVAVVS